MKSLYKVFAAIVAASVLSAAAFAADPSGTWTFPAGFGRGAGPGGGAPAAPGGGQARGGGGQQTLTLTYANGKLTGQLAGGRGEPVAITAASVKDDVVEFAVERTGRDGTKRLTKYVGKLAGDTITGTLEGPGRGGEVMKRDWVATRAK